MNPMNDTTGRTTALVLALLLAAGSAGCGSRKDRPAAENAGAARPNLVVYLVDTLRADHLGCYGYDRDTSPNLDRLAREGVLFEQVHAQSNWTQPSVASILSSRPPLVFRSFTRKLPEEILTLAEVLKTRGYRTAGFTTTVAVSAEFGFDQGFEVYGESGKGESFKALRLREGSLFDADTLNAMAFPWIEENARAEPFFLYMHSVDPHMPYTPPPAYDIFDPGYRGPVDGRLKTIQAVKEGRLPVTDADRRHVIALYDGEIRFNDHEIGRLLRKLEEAGVLDRTLVVVLSDHGEELYDRGDRSSGHGHMNLFTELTHIPLILRLPGTLPAGRRVPGLAAGLDVMPTILDILGVDPPPGLAGRSLLPRILDPAEGTSPDREIFSFRAKEMKDLAALRTPDRLYVHPPYKEPVLYAVEGEGGGQRLEPIPELPAARRAQWERRLRGYLRASREDTLRYMKPGETPLSDDARRKLKALGYLK